MLFRRRPNIVRAVQFDRYTVPWPDGVNEWEDPITAFSPGYLVIEGERTPVNDGDWIVTWGKRTWKVEADEFPLLYEPLPGAVESVDPVHELHAVDASRRSWPPRLPGNQRTSNYDIAAEKQFAGAINSVSDWLERMDAEGWVSQVDGTWTNGVTTLYLETITRLMANNLTPGELGLFTPGTIVSDAAATPE